MKRLPVALRRSMTYDRGSDPLMVCEQTTAGQWMACHPELSRRLKIDIWFCDPHTPWQRGSNKNTNGLLRQFFPKGTDLGCLSQAALNDVASLMNDRPRKTLGWRTPAEAMAENLAAIKLIVALQSWIQGIQMQLIRQNDVRQIYLAAIQLKLDRIGWLVAILWHRRAMRKHGLPHQRVRFGMGRIADHPVFHVEPQLRPLIRLNFEL
uniref:IS30 family transposase n=1 Tax=Octadecabacter antarcticus TaxID=1217908 RepID=UPI00018062E6|nr:IS30 family transposase [Octadecabacter antarcticus]